eukprot:jgi/Bigna1/83954/fgenesh1_pg.119_\
MHVLPDADSAVVAALLKEQGQDVVAVHMSNWDSFDEKGECEGEKDKEVARAVCKHLDIELHEISFVNEYWTLVFQELLDGYERGVTPNPDILCNRHIKFDALLDYARDRLGARSLATGHYAKIEVGEDNKTVNLCQAADSKKDQTYFLSSVRQESLPFIQLPLAEYTKAQVRNLARDKGLPNADKRASAGICMVGRRRFDTFIQGYLRENPGWFIDLQGNRLHQHQGLHFWTIGQRAKIPNMEAAWFVAHRDAASNSVVVCDRQHPSLNGRRLLVRDINWFDSGRHLKESLLAAAEGAIDDPEKRFLQVGVRARHQQLVKTSRVAARHFQGQLVLQVEMESEMFAPAEGQAVSFYLGDVCVAGGAIGLVLDRHQHLLDAPVDLSAFEEASAICNDGINHS